MDANESFEQAAKFFYKATGYLMPGKEIAAASGWTEEKEEDRRKLFKVWCAAIDYMKRDEGALAVAVRERDEAIEHARQSMRQEHERLTADRDRFKAECEELRASILGAPTPWRQRAEAAESSLSLALAELEKGKAFEPLAKQCWQWNGDETQECAGATEQRKLLALAREEIARKDAALKAGLLFVLERNAMLNGWADGDEKRKNELWRALHAEGEKFWNALVALNNGHHPVAKKAFATCPECGNPNNLHAEWCVDPVVSAAPAPSKEAGKPCERCGETGQVLFAPHDSDDVVPCPKCAPQPEQEKP